MFVGKADPFRCSSLGYAPGLTHKHYTRLAVYKHSSLLRKSVYYGQKSFTTLSPGSSWLQQQVHDRHRVALGRHLLHLHHGAPPLQHDRHNPAAGAMTFHQMAFDKVAINLLQFGLDVDWVRSNLVACTEVACIFVACL
jgi:hypothetical protein